VAPVDWLLVGWAKTLRWRKAERAMLMVLRLGD